MAEKRSKKSGFTLIELLITIFIVSIGLVGVISFFNASLESQFEAKNEVIAAGLAQEATELTRNIVDYNFLNLTTSLYWWKELAGSSDATGGCTLVDIKSLENHQCITSDDTKSENICFNGTNNVNKYYQCEAVDPTGTETIFKRKLEIAGEDLDESADIDLNLKDCLHIVATVGWPTSSSDCDDDIAKCDRKTKSESIICKPRV